LPVRGIAFGGGRFVAVQGDGSIESSSDGKSWTRSDGEPDKGNYSILWTGKQFLVSGGKVSLVSPDGLTWTRTTSRIPCSPLAVRAGDSEGLQIPAGNIALLAQPLLLGEVLGGAVRRRRERLDLVGERDQDLERRRGRLVGHREAELARDEGMGILEQGAGD